VAYNIRKQAYRTILHFEGKNFINETNEQSNHEYFSKVYKITYKSKKPSLQNPLYICHDEQYATSFSGFGETFLWRIGLGLANVHLSSIEQTLPSGVI
jgi:hypothetical protein